MKKSTGLSVIVVALLLAIILVLPIKGYADWVLYDDFESSEIDWLLWDPYGDWTGAIGERYIENGKLKIILDTGPANSKFGLSFKQYTEEIKAIRASVNIVSCTGDGRVKIRGDWIYDYPNEFQQAINIWGAEERIVTWREYYNSETEEDIFISRLSSENPVNIIGKQFVVTIWFLSSKLDFAVRGLGRIRYVEEMTNPLERHYNIDVRSYDGGGTCTAYFDDIEIFIDN